MGMSLFRFIAALGRTLVVANTFGFFVLLLVYVLGGFIIAKGEPQLFFCTLYSIGKIKCMTESNNSFTQSNWVKNGSCNFNNFLYRKPWTLDEMGLLYFSYDVRSERHCHQWISRREMERCKIFNMWKFFSISFSCKTAFIYLLCSPTRTIEFLSQQLGRLFSGLEACLLKTIGTGFALVLSLAFLCFSTFVL